MWGGRGGFAPFSSLSCASEQGRRAAKQQGRRRGCCEETAVGGRRMIPESVTESWNGSCRKRPGSSSPNALLGGKLGGRRQRTGAGKGKRLIQAHPGSLQCFSRWFFLLPLVAWAGPGAGKGFASCLEPWGSLSLLRTGFLEMPVGSRRCGHTAEPWPNIPASFVPGTPFPAPFRWKWLVNTSPHILSHGTRRSCCSSGRMRRNRRFSPRCPFLTPPSPATPRSFHDPREFPAA